MMARKRNWWLSWRVFFALLLTAGCVLWVYISYTHWSLIAAHDAQRVALTAGALSVLLPALGWIGVSERRAWMQQLALALGWTLISIVTISTALSRELELSDWPLKLAVVMNPGLALGYWVQAFKQRKKAIEAMRAQKAEEQ